MEFDWDEGKDAANRAKHGVGFDVAAQLDWANAIIEPDLRSNYDEKRDVAYAYIGERLHVCVFTLRNNRYRIISLRKANRREDRKYGRRDD